MITTDRKHNTTITHFKSRQAVLYLLLTLVSSHVDMTSWSGTKLGHCIFRRNKVILVAQDGPSSNLCFTPEQLDVVYGKKKLHDRFWWLPFLVSSLNFIAPRRNHQAPKKDITSNWLHKLKILSRIILNVIVWWNQQTSTSSSRISTSVSMRAPRLGFVRPKSPCTNSLI